MIQGYLNTSKPLITQLQKHGLELDQKLYRALQVSASKPDTEPEDCGFPDSYLLLALYRMNTFLTRLTRLDETRYNLFHEYLLAPRCSLEEVVPGKRLCSLLNEIVSWSTVTQTIGVGHFLQAIAKLSMHGEPEDLSWLGFPGQVSHNTFSIETLLIGHGHHAWTPLRDAPEVQHVLNQVERYDPVDDYQFIVTLGEDDHVAFRPVSVLDDYALHNEKQHFIPVRAYLTHFQDRYGGFTVHEIAELERLMNDMRVRESHLQEFFEAHPHFFRKWDYREVYPQVYLINEHDKRLIPDFILTNPDVQQATILDLKLPKAKLIRRKKNRERFADAVQDAIAQLRKYYDWFDNPRNRDSIKDTLGMEIYRPRLAIVIGRSAEFRSAYERQLLNSRERDIEIITYDDILHYAQQRRIILTKEND